MARSLVFGIIGAGRIGRLHAENIVHHVPGVTLKAIADIRASEIQDWATELGIPIVTSHPEEIIKDKEIDAVIICSSTDTHVQFIIDSAQAGKDIFCEKPIGKSVDNIKKALRIVKESGVKLQVGFNRRFDHNFKRVRDAVTSGDIGTPHLVKITSRDPAPPPIDYIKVSGGLFFDMTIHDWDMARFIIGDEVDEVFAKGNVLIDPEIGNAGDIDTAVAVLKFKNGALGVIDNSRQAVYGYDQRVEIFGSKGAAIADNDSTNSVKIFSDSITKMDTIPYFFLERYLNSYVNEMKTFTSCIRENKMPPVSGIDGLNAVLIAFAAQKSLKENRPIKIEY
ncbi:MAG: inositol 2-dehydrogenase [Promethearchaeota archaeon]